VEGVLRLRPLRQEAAEGGEATVHRGEDRRGHPEGVGKGEGDGAGGVVAIQGVGEEGGRVGVVEGGGGEGAILKTGLHALCEARRGDAIASVPKIDW